MQRRNTSGFKLEEILNYAHLVNNHATATLFTSTYKYAKYESFSVISPKLCQQQSSRKMG